MEKISLLGMVSNSFGCSASGERLVSAARDGDLQEAKALLEYNPRLARYSTFGVRNSPLHHSAARGHHEIVFLLLESGVDIDLRNTRGQTALMLACRYGHWEVVQILILFNANIHKTDYLNGGTALHFAALNGHSRCVRLLLADYVPSIPDFCSIMRKEGKSAVKGIFDASVLSGIVNQRADGGLTALHMAALNGHADAVQLLLDLGACVSMVTVEDGTTIDLIGAGSTPLHYAACGGNAQCCLLLILRGASLTAKNANGWTPLMVALSWRRNWLENILSRKPEGCLHVHPSPYLSLPLMSIMKIARECGWRSKDPASACTDPCVVCLERKCTVAAEGCAHELCTSCALYLCSTNSGNAVSGPPGSLACPLCRNAIVSFIKLPGASPRRGLPRMTMPLALCASGAAVGSESAKPLKVVDQLCRPDFQCISIPTFGCSSFRSSYSQKLSCMKFCMGNPDIRPSLIRYSRSRLRRSDSNGESQRSCLFPNL